MKNIIFNLLFLGTINFISAQCPTPYTLYNISINTNSVNLGWGTSGTFMWQLEYGPVDFIPGNGIKVTVGSNPYVLNNLSGATFYDVYVRDTCLNGSVSNWFGPLSFKTPCATGAVATPVTYDFESSNWIKSAAFNDPGTISGCWSRGPLTPNFTIAVGPPFSNSNFTGPAGDHTTGSGKYVYAEIIGNPISTNNAVFGSPRFDISNLNNPELSFWYHLFGNDIDVLVVQAKDINQSTWVTLASYNQEQMAKSDPWKEANLSLSSLNADTINLRFVARKFNGYAINSHMALDDISILEGPTCPKPLQLNVQSTSSNSASINWVSGGATHWQIEYGPAPFTLGSGTKVNTNNNPHTITGLTPNTLYTFYLRDSCGVNDKSNWVGPISARTQCVPTLAPFTENFDGPSFVLPSNINIGNIDPCWERTATQGYFWDAGPPFYASTFTGPTGDHTTGSGKYLYTEVSSTLTFPAISEIYSTSIDLTAITIPELTFYYHMLGSGIGKLYVDVNNGTGWVNKHTITGQQQTAKTDAWKEAIVNLSGYANDTIELRFRGEINTYTNTEISIDDIDLHQQPTCPKPTNLNVLAPQATSANISWTTGGASNALIKYKTTVGLPNIVPAATNPFNLTGLLPNTEYLVWIKDSCGLNDVSLWVGPVAFKTNCLPVTAPYIQNFESSDFIISPNFFNRGTLNPCFNVIDDENFYWDVGPSIFTNNNSGPAIDHTTGTGKFLYTEVKSFINSPNEAVLETPYIDLKALTVPELSFWYHMYGNDIGTLKVDVRTNGAWANLWSLAGEQQSSKTDPWKEVILSLAAYANDTIQLRFNHLNANVGVYDLELCIDDIDLHETPSCPKPTQLKVVNTLATTATINWTTGGASNWLVKYQPVMGGVSTIIPASNHPFTITGLTPSTAYNVWVKDSCGAGDVSQWQGPKEAKTACNLFLLPYNENFNGTSWVTTYSTFLPGSIDPCWTRSHEDDFYWRAGNGTSASNFNTGPDSDHSPIFGKFIYSVSAGMYNPTKTDIYSPWFDLSGVTQPQLNFYYHMYGSDIGSLIIGVEKSDGTVLAIDSIVSQQHFSGNAAWLLKNVSLTNYANDTIRIKFISRKELGIRSEVAIDDFELINLGCADPTLVSTLNVLSNAVDISWTGGASQSNLEFDVTGFTFGTGTVVSNISSTYNLSGLQPNTTYDFYLQDSCAVGNSSTWVGPFTFTTDCEPLALNFDYTNHGFDLSFDGSISVATNASYTWDFGDGTTGTGINTNHTYAASGTYTVKLDVLDACGNRDSFTKNVMVCDLPVADFTYTIVGTNALLDGTSSLNTVTYLWELGNGGLSALPNPTAGYQSNGVYTVTLYATNACGETDTLTQDVIVCDKPTAKFNYKIISSSGAGMIVDFDGTVSIGGNIFEWNFGDGTVNTTSATPQHIYAVPGLFYLVTLKVKNSCGGFDIYSVQLSDLVSLEEIKLAQLQLFPNPAGSSIYLNGIDFEKENLTLTFHNIAGQQLQLEVQKTKSQVKVEIDKLPPGVYIVTVHLNAYSKSIRMIKQ